MPKLTNGISQKMKNFCHAYVESGNAARAYLTAYDTNSETVAYSEGKKLLKRDDVTEYIEQLTRPTVNKITNERERKRNIIWERIEKCRGKGDDAAIARYMDILNKMDAEYVNINRNIDDSGEKLAGLNTEQLKALLDSNE